MVRPSLIHFALAKVKAHQNVTRKQGFYSALTSVSCPLIKNSRSVSHVASTRLCLSVLSAPDQGDAHGMSFPSELPAPN